MYAWVCAYVHGKTLAPVFLEPSLRSSLTIPSVHHFHLCHTLIPIFTVDIDVPVADHWTHSLDLLL